MAKTFQIKLISGETLPPYRSVAIDNIAYETTARRRGWPTDPKESLHLYTYFLAWHAYHRQGIVTAEFDDWLETVEELIVTDDTPAPTEADAYPPAAGTGSLSNLL